MGWARCYCIYEHLQMVLSRLYVDCILQSTGVVRGQVPAHHLHNLIPVIYFSPPASCYCNTFKRCVCSETDALFEIWHIIHAVYPKASLLNVKAKLYFQRFYFNSNKCQTELITIKWRPVQVRSPDPDHILLGGRRPMLSPTALVIRVQCFLRQSRRRLSSESTVTLFRERGRSSSDRA